jgi:hypothetical protein
MGLASTSNKGLQGFHHSVSVAGAPVVVSASSAPPTGPRGFPPGGPSWCICSMPAARGRWPTGSSRCAAPSIAIRAGRNRCMPRNCIGSRRAKSARKALSVHPVSRMDSRSTRLRTALASRLPMRLDQCPAGGREYPAAHVAGRPARHQRRDVGGIVLAVRVQRDEDAPRAARNAAPRAALCPELRRQPQDAQLRKFRSQGPAGGPAWHRWSRRPPPGFRTDRPMPRSTPTASRTTASMHSSSL